jgi:hypothetical protein
VLEFCATPTHRPFVIKDPFPHGDMPLGIGIVQTSVAVDQREHVPAALSQNHSGRTKPPLPL